MPSRPFRDLQDLASMSALVSSAWALHGPNVECTIGDLAWRLYRNAEVRPELNLRLWTDESDRLVGFAWRYANGDVDLLVHPRAQAPSVVPEMLRWSRERSDGEGSHVTAWTLESNAPVTAAILGAGWRPTGGCYLHLARSLDAPLEASRLPSNYVVRSIRGPEEAEQRAEVHRRAFGSERLTTEMYRTLMTAAAYRVELDLVAQTTNGEFAALALCWLDTTNAVGEFEPVATAPAHRRRGLARCLIEEGLRRLKAAGARSAIVYARADDPAAVALYTRAGFLEVDRNLGYRPPAR